MPGTVIHGLINPDQDSLTRDQLAAILGGLAEGVTVQDAAGHLVYANDVAALLSGYPTGESMLAGPTEAALARFALLDEAGRPFPPERLPGRLLLAGQDAPETVIGFRSLETTQERWAIVDATPIRDAAGRVQFAVNIFREITERKRGEDAARFVATLADCSQRP